MFVSKSKVWIYRKNLLCFIEKTVEHIKNLKYKQNYNLSLTYNIRRKGWDYRVKNPKILYILISVFCVFAIIAGIYAQFIDEDAGQVDLAGQEEQNTIDTKTQQEISDQFNSLLINTLNLGSFDTTGIQKINADENIVYTAIDMEQNSEMYEISIHVPVINIRSDLSNTFNQNTQTTFINKANEILNEQNSEGKTIYSINYAAYVNGNILSVVIESTLKEGSQPQRVIVQTYNYNLSTNTEASLIDLITVKQLNRDEVNAKINQVVSAAAQEDEALEAMGYNQIYIRDLTSDIYNVDNAGAFFLGPNQELYIIYAYGNSEYTSKMDIILFE